MNKLKLFTLSAVAALSVGLVSCDVTEKGNIVVEFTNGSSAQITADELYNQYKLTSTGTKAYYDAVYNVVLRQQMNNYVSKKAELVAKATSQVEGVKATATDNKDKNGTNYDDELEKLLDSNGVDTLEELQTKFEDALFKTFLEDSFYSWSMEFLKDGVITESMKENTAFNTSYLENGSEKYIGDFESYINNLIPYHVKHILVKVSASAGEYARATITKDEAVKLSYVIQSLSEVTTDNSFGRVAQQSDDTASASKNGDLGVMSRNTSYVNEFKLGIYTYDSLFNTALPTDDNRQDNLGLVHNSSQTDNLSQLENIGLGEIPYGAVELLNQYSNVTLDGDQHKVNLGAAVTFPRNIIFNNYFNMHNISVITSDSVDASGAVVHDGAFKDKSAFKDVSLKQYDALGNPTAVTKNILCDENGNPVLVTRAGTSGDNSYEGIHFIVVQRSALLKEADANGVNISDYYTTYIPGNTNFPKDGTGADKICYVNYYGNSDTSSYLTRSNALKDDIKTSDPSISVKMYKYFVAMSGATIKDATVSQKINDYIASTEVKNTYNADKTMSDAWKAYCNMLGVQENNKARKFPMTCALKYLTASSSAEFDKGGVCYYEA